MQSGREFFSVPRRRYRRFSLVELLIGLNVAVFVLELLAEIFLPRVPYLLEEYFALSRGGIRNGYYWQFITYMFLHGGAIHLLVNVLGLYFAGREVENIVGRKHFLGIYFAGGVLGGVAQVLLGDSVIGASAGVCAVLLAFTTILPELEITALLFFVIPFRMRAKWLGRAVIASSILFAYVGFGKDIGHVAHLVGALTGWVYTRRLGYGVDLFAILRERKEDRERMEQINSGGDFISEEIDPILDKISREGIHSLTRAERRILEQGRDKIANRTRQGR